MITIANRRIGENQPPFIVAEMSGNHNRSLERALAIVDAAAEAGAHALKIQTYTAETMTLDLKEGEFIVNDPDSLWAGQSLYSLYEKAHTPWEWHQALFDRARQKGLIPFSTPFDETAVDFLETLDAPCYKIASFEMTDLPLIRKVAATGKPMIISTGMATAGEIDETVRAARSAGCKDLILLKCTSTYPASPEDTNLNTIPHLRQLTHCEVGLSDHTMSVGVAVAAVALGATVIEKHFTLARSEGGVDSAFSLEPSELKLLVQETERAWRAMGQVRYGTSSDAEQKSLAFRRSLYVTQAIKAGETFTIKNIRSIRPGLGLPTKYLELIIGKRANRDIKPGTPLNWNQIG